MQRPGPLRFAVGVLLFCGTPAFAEDSLETLAGIYDGHQTEVGAALQLDADGRFQYYLSYGALDEMASGTWTVADDGIVLDSDPVTIIPEFALVDSKGGKGSTFDIALDVPGQMPVEYFSAIVIFADGTGRREDFEETGLHLKLARGQAVSAVALQLRVYDVLSEEFAVPPGTASMYFRFKPNDLGTVAFDHEPLAREGDAFLLSRYDRVLRFRKVPLDEPAQAETPYVFQPGHIDLDRGPDGNTVILDAPEGLIVVDTGRHAEHSLAILDYAKAAGRPIAAIVNSHWHLDHTTGNQDVLAAFPEAELIASSAAAGALTGFLARAPDNARKRIADPALSPEEHRRAERALAITTHPEMLVPVNPVTASGLRIIAGRTIDVHLAPNAATEGDIWLLAPDERLAIAGDLVVAQAPFFDTGCEDGWEAALDEIAAADWTTLIPGHGAPMDRAGFDRWHTAFTTYVDCARSDASAEACAAGWERDAAGFYSEAEAPAVRDLALYYVTDILRGPPEARMDYCRNRVPGGA